MFRICSRKRTPAQTTCSQEDLTPEATVRLLEALKATQGKGIPAEVMKPGPVSGRQSCEPKSGLTSLTSDPTTFVKYVRKDL
jgi:NADH dehydrogenase (ubiquinone) flavoprotein 2